MNYRKNLTGEQKATFILVDITAQLSIENKSFLTSGNIISLESMLASHADFDELYTDRF